MIKYHTLNNFYYKYLNHINNKLLIRNSNFEIEMRQTNIFNGY